VIREYIETFSIISYFEKSDKKVIFKIQGNKEEIMSEHIDQSALSGAKPLFLIGAPRSGTTLLTRILNAHPELLLTNETAIFLQLNEMVSKSRIGVKAGILYGKQHHTLWADHLNEQVLALVDRYYSKIATIEGKKELKYWGEKHPHLNRCLEFIAEHYPNARFIYVVRDPRDSACSISEMNKTEIQKTLKNWGKFTQRYEHFLATLTPKNVIVVRYEDVVANYEGETERVLDWLGLDMHPNVKKYIRKNKNVDSHKVEALVRVKHNFAEKSVGRWKKELTEDEKNYASHLLGQYMEKFGYDLVGDGVLNFTCNICKHKNRVVLKDLNRERRSCDNCCSSVRTRSVMHLLSMELFGKGIPLTDFQANRDIKGIGMSDWNGYAKLLAKKLGYTNTFYHKSPKLDITDIRQKDYGKYDFIISSDVFEHVHRPVFRAFENTRKLLKDDGVFIFTVPYMVKIDKTIEHFPELYHSEVLKRDNGDYFLRHIKANGTVEEFDNLRFHGGAGSTLELRIFSFKDVISYLNRAGFSRVKVCDDAVIEYGIIWGSPSSIPIVARP